MPHSRIIAFFAASMCLWACSGHSDGHGHGNENELITTVSLSFTPVGGGDALVFEVDDPDGDGGDPPTVDTVTLAPGDYDLSITFENRLESPAEDITEEVSDEGDEHQVFVTGSAVDGPASDEPGAPLSHSYADQDANGLPIGLSNDIVASEGDGDITVTLRHLPPVGDQNTKTEDLSGLVASDGFAAIPGTSDAQVTLPVSVE